VNTDVLRTWLGLPAGPWPPDDRTLLGLPVGPITPTLVEERALAQMEKLRPYQLAQPDLVTEGMNRLAQALDSLTTPLAPPPPVVAQPAVPVAQANVAPQPATATIADADIVLDADKLKPTASIAPPLVFDAEIITAPKPRPPKAKTKRKRPKPEAKPRNEPPAAAVEVPEVFAPAKRRAGYAELVALRTVSKAWQQLQPWFAVPSDAVETPAAVYGFLVAVRDCRQIVAIHGDREWFLDHGSLVLALLRSPQSLAVFRSLIRSQRHAIATDWAYTAALLKGRYDGLREELNATKPRRPINKLLRRTKQWMREHPEWLLGVALVLLWALTFAKAAR
jgi:hypothetical protein